MSCLVHALCESDYAGMVDIGEASPDPVMTQPLSPENHWGPQFCCVCSEPAKYYLRAAPNRFEKPCFHNRNDEMHNAAELNFRMPRNQVVQTDQPHVGQDSHPS